MSNNEDNPCTDPPNTPSNFVPISRNADGSITRCQFPTVPASSDPNSDLPVLSKDLPLNPQNGTWVRLFLRRESLNRPYSTPKQPLVVFFHGSGFALCSADTPIFHDICVDMVTQVGVVVVSVRYRLAPDHRLPAAYDDAVEALQWVRSNPDDWLSEYADFSNSFLMGSSAGANIAYHLGLRVAGDDLAPLKIRGLILNHPFFGGVERSGSELRLSENSVFPLTMSDLFWEIALPTGADRDHEYSNLKMSSELVTQFKLMGWRVMVTGCDGDPLFDRQVELVNTLKEKGVTVVAEFDQGGIHGEEYLATKALKLMEGLKHFIHSM